LALSLLIVVLLGLSPLVIKAPFLRGIVILTVIYAYVGISWNIVAGFAGQLLIAHLIFFAAGAYTTIMLLEHLGVTPWLGIPAAALVAGLMGLVVSFITLRYGLKEDYFALFTIAVMVALSPLISKWKLAGEASGIYVMFEGVSFRNMAFVSKLPYLYIALGLLVIGMIVQYRVFRSKLGRYFLAIREDERAAEALGVNTALYKTIAVLIGSAMAGSAGGFYVMYTTFINPPQIFNLGINVEIALVAPIIGGLGSLIGPVLGAILNKPSVELIRVWFTGQQTSGASLIVYGVFLIVFILFLPRGVAGWIEDGPYAWLRRRVSNGDPERAKGGKELGDS
jgi:branched-chain amino acid transport system permease protein